MDVAHRLSELGLTPKEASVYAALLEIGNAAVSDIAEKSDVNRSTVYTTLASLKDRGLVSEIDEGDVTKYIAESPERLRETIRTAKHVVETQEEKLQHAMPYLLGIFNNHEKKPGVRFFEGEEGVRTMREILMEQDGEWCVFECIDEKTMVASKIYEEQRLKNNRRTSGKYLYSVKPGCALPRFDSSRWEHKQIPYEQKPFSGELCIAGNIVTAFGFTGAAPIGFLVESKDFVAMFRSLFETAWKD
jgi:predicted transcriptional regulator